MDRCRYCDAVADLDGESLTDPEIASDHRTATAITNRYAVKRAHGNAIRLMAAAPVTRMLAAMRVVMKLMATARIIIGAPS